MTARSAPDSSLYIGLMSGTSLDGVDAVLVDCSTAAPQTMAHTYRAFTADLRAALAALCVSGPDEIERAGVAARELVHVYAAGVDELLLTARVERSAVRAIGAHGQTVRHRPHLGFSLQLNAPAWLAELTGIDVVADFRNQDIAAGGQGAPLASIFHVAAFSSAQARAVVNIGGISNLTGLPGKAMDGGEVIGFDCGPGNLLLDYWTQQNFALPFDADGALAASAQPDPLLLAALLSDPFFAVPPPKSTGRELFSSQWLGRALKRDRRQLDPAVVLATLTCLTSTAIADSIERWFAQAADVVVCGGGSRNATLLRTLATACAPRAVMTSSALGVEPEQVEALAFAWLAHACINRESGNVPTVTGARGRRVLGALYPSSGRYK
ncbi:MAG: anhydro-N-acetylmuramic acid kinase [Burkholderiaceae bacterium]|nr:anhydro-N-acetylmuramic acid kinase [Burkholderiaceae bacterium]